MTDDIKEVTEKCSIFRRLIWLGFIVWFLAITYRCFNLDGANSSYGEMSLWQIAIEFAATLMALSYAYVLAARNVENIVTTWARIIIWLAIVAWIIPAIYTFEYFGMSSRLFALRFSIAILSYPLTTMIAYLLIRAQPAKMQKSVLFTRACGILPIVHFAVAALVGR